MSYDLMVFDPGAAPRERAQFIEWYREQTEWSGYYSDIDPTISSDGLQRWYYSMLPSWPNMQEVSDEKADDPHVTGYTIGKCIIYVDFRWTVAEEAYDAVRSAAVDNQVGFYDVSGDEGDGEVYFPGDLPKPPSDGTWRDVSQQFKANEFAPTKPKASWLGFFRRKQ